MKSFTTTWLREAACWRMEYFLRFQAPTGNFMKVFCLCKWFETENWISLCMEPEINHLKSWALLDAISFRYYLITPWKQNNHIGTKNMAACLSGFWFSWYPYSWQTTVDLEGEFQVSWRTKKQVTQPCNSEWWHLHFSWHFPGSWEQIAKWSLALQAEVVKGFTEMSIHGAVEFWHAVWILTC